jgi:tripartite-type tricarboxylate transporter receptor subunit TctC
MTDGENFVSAARTTRVGFISLVLSSLILAVIAASVQAQGWPNKPIRLIVTFAPGGGSDAFARPLITKLSTQLGQQVIIDNRGGAGGTIGAGMASKSVPDGYTFMVGTVHHTVAVSVYKSLPYDFEKDLIPITGLAYVPDVLLVNNKVPAQTVKELIAYAKSNVGKLNYGSSGKGTTRHLAGEIFNNMAGISLTHIPYKGSGPAYTGLLSGEIQMIFEGLGGSASHILGGSVRALAVTSPKRSPSFPDLPTMAEAGVPGFESMSWYGLFAPTGTPPEILRRMQTEVNNALASEELKTIWFRQGAAPGGEPSNQFAQFTKAEIEKWGKIARHAKVTID